MRCFQAVLDKCNDELVKSGNLIYALRYKRRYPHTGFFQKNWGQLNQMNCRTVDMIKSSQNLNVPLRPRTLLEIHQANVRFQMAVQNLVLTRSMLSTAVDELMAKMSSYNELLLQQQQGTTGQNNESDNDSESMVVSSSTTAFENPEDSSANAAPSSSIESQLRSKLSEIQMHMNIVQSFLNQLPMLSCPLRMELHLMEIYDNYDDSETVHLLLIDPTTAAAINQNATNRGAVIPVVHDWEEITSESTVRRKFEEITNNLRSQQQQRTHQQPQQQ